MTQKNKYSTVSSFAIVIIYVIGLNGCDAFPTTTMSTTGNYINVVVKCMKVNSMFVDWICMQSEKEFISLIK